MIFPTTKKFNGPLVKVKAKCQIVIPYKFRKMLGIEEGDYMEMELDTKKRLLLLKPKILIDKEDTWFWSKEWQDKEREADESLASGDYREFEDVDDVIKFLKK